MRYACLLAVLGVLAVALVPRATAKEHSRSRVKAADHALMARLLGRIATHRDETWRWQRVIDRAPTPYRDSAPRIRSVAYRKWVLDLWHQRAVAAKQPAPPERMALHPRPRGVVAEPDAPYYGGFQMDREFQATYARSTCAPREPPTWTPLEQMWVAERAYRTRGFCAMAKHGEVLWPSRLG